MELISVSQQTGDVDEDVFKAEKAAGHVLVPVMAGLAELLHTVGMGSPTHNPSWTPRCPAVRRPAVERGLDSAEKIALERWKDRGPMLCGACVDGA